MKQSSIAVGIIARNASYTIGRALQSLVKQSVAPDEIIVVDDASSDDTSKTCLDFGLPNLHLVRSDVPLGIPGARNAVLQNCSSEFLAWLDADDTCMVNRLEVQSRYLERYPLVVALGSRSNTYSQLARKTGRHGRWVREGDKPFAIGSRAAPALLFGNPIPTSSLMLRMGSIRNTNVSFDTGLRVAEDFDFLHQVLRFGQVHLLPQKLISRWESFGGASDLNHGELVSASRDLLRYHLGYWGLNEETVSVLERLAPGLGLSTDETPNGSSILRAFESVMNHNALNPRFSPKDLRLTLLFRISVQVLRNPREGLRYGQWSGARIAHKDDLRDFLDYLTVSLPSWAVSDFVSRLHGNPRPGAK